MAYNEIAVTNPVLSFTLLTYIITGSYFIVFLIIYTGWLKLPVYYTSVPVKPVSVSIIIAVRNESDTIPLLINDLLHQNYPADYFDIILIDDHSEEPLSELADIKNYPGENLRTFSLPENTAGKKAAILEGVKNSQSELLVFTDADCRVGPEWIRTYVHYYNSTSSVFFIGLIDYKNKPGILHAFFRAEMLSLVISSAGSASLGFATLCNGANMAVERSTYNQHINDLEMHIPSGDDVFLLHAIKRKNPASVAVVKNRYNLVTTQPPESLYGFLNQRSRWASKSFQYTDTATIVMAVLVLVTNLALILLFAGTIYGILSWRILLIHFLIKTTADCFILTAGLSFVGKKKYVLLIPFFELIYPFYLSIAAFFGLFSLYTWKGRSGRTKRFI